MLTKEKGLYQKKSENFPPKKIQLVKLSIPQATHRQAIVLIVAVSVYIAKTVVQDAAPSVISVVL